MRVGVCDPTTNTSLDGEDIYHRLNNGNFILWPVVISPHGKWGDMWHNRLTDKIQGDYYKFPPSRLEAENMYYHSMSHPVPVGIAPLATATWRKEKLKQQYFHGHSYMCPTPKEFSFQGIGLAISNAVAIHIRDAREVKLVEPSDADWGELETYECLMASDTDNKLVVLATITMVHILSAEAESYPSLDFTSTLT